MDARPTPMDAQPAWERELDALVRPAFVADPPPSVQQAILAAVIQATAATARPAPLPVTATPVPTARPVSLAAYLLLAAVLVAYAATLSWVQSLVGGAGWLPTLVIQVLAVSELIVGPLPASEPLTLAWLALQRAPWLALLPLAWLLWERDRAAGSQPA